MKQPTLIIEAGRSEKNYWLDLWRYRELFLILAWRDISVRYKQTFVGVSWALLQPFLQIVVFTLVFSWLLNTPSEGDAPYAIMAFAAMLPWQFFATALTNSSQSVVGSSNLISKVYFPRLIVPCASMVVCLIDFLIASLIFGLLALWYQFLPDWRILTLPFFLLVAFLAALGPGLLIAAMNVRYRDFRYVLPFIIQFGLYASAVPISLSLIREKLLALPYGEHLYQLYCLNPMVGVIDGFRWALLGGESQLYWPGFCISLAAILIMLWVGIHFFRKTERTFADII
ncbi:MAG: ABC transporter permease [Verrucomicrobiota bacterium]